MMLVQIAGFVGKDPETRETNNGQKVTNLSLAVNVKKDAPPIWWRVTIWGTHFDKILPHIKKGSALIVMGDMKPPEKYTSKDGVEGIRMEVTAEMIKFSPFGNPDKKKEEQKPQTMHGTQAGKVEENDFPF